jgi:hypothetical protein
MKKRKVVLSATYSLGQISVGLVLHPYQTMQNLVREKIFVWMTLLPSLVLMIVTALWKIIIVPLVGLFFSCAQSKIIGCDWLVFVSNAITFYCIYWQILLFYLLVRFNLVFKNKGK